jgi:hypothetical protein
LLYECKVLWNIIVKGIEIWIFKGKVYDYVKYMVGEWCGIIITHDLKLAREYKEITMTLLNKL